MEEQEGLRRSGEKEGLGGEEKGPGAARKVLAPASEPRLRKDRSPAGIAQASTKLSKPSGGSRLL